MINMLIFIGMLLFSATAFSESSVYDRMLVKAIYSDDIDKAETMLKNGANLNNHDRNIWIQRNKPSLKMMKLFKKYNVDMKSNSDCVLQDVVWKNYEFQEVKFLVDNGSDVHCYTKHNSLINRLVNLPWHQADKGKGDKYKAIEYILEKGAKNDLNTYHYSYRLSGERKASTGVKPIESPYADNLTFLKYGTKINEISNQKYGSYPIHLMKYDDSKKAVEYVIEHGGNINQLDGNGKTLLDHVRTRDNEEYELWLIQKGAKYSADMDIETEANHKEDGTVIENDAKLMWKRCSEGQRWTGETCKGDAESYRFSTAKLVAKDSDFAGHSDWRLPTLKELQSLVVCSIGKKKAFSTKQDRSMSSRLQGGIQDGGCTGTMSEMKEQRPTINKSKFPRTASFRYWSSTSSKTGAAWIVNFHHGGSKGEQDFYSPNKEIAKIRLVRKVQ